MLLAVLRLQRGPLSFVLSNSSCRKTAAPRECRYLQILGIDGGPLMLIGVCPKKLWGPLAGGLGLWAGSGHVLVAVIKCLTKTPRGRRDLFGQMV